ncbi:MAG: Cu(I)/Ag(I) efflux system membrane fusion protein [Halieaceae bacterium]|jgi:Cu(I)/Ag(I) efflux system membrane fusion protein
MNKLAIFVASLCLVLGLGTGYLIFGTNNMMPATVTVEKAKPLFYRNPMNPLVTSPVPAKGSMGMDYIPVYKDAESTSIAGTVIIDPTVQNNIGLRTAIAERRAFSRTIRATARVDYDEEKLVRLHPKVDGWVKDIQIDKTGQPVGIDDILLSIYSPKLVATQQEYLLALNNLEALKDSRFEDISLGARALVKSSRERLKLLDVAEHQIRELEESGKIKDELHIHAPSGGTVLRIGARNGQYVTPASELYLIADLSKVWVYADVYDYELPWVKQGDQVEMSLASVPGRVFEGVLAYIYPYASSKTRTTRIRMVFDNPDLLLRPEMFADVIIHSDTKLNQIVIPAESVIRSGDYNQIFVMTKPGTLVPRKVSLGVESGGYVTVVEGLSEGEIVVSSAQFLIDSESKLREATAKMVQPTDTAKPADDEMKHSNHGDMSHD